MTDIIRSLPIFSCVGQQVDLCNDTHKGRSGENYKSLDRKSVENFTRQNQCKIFPTKQPFLFDQVAGHLESKFLYQS